MQSETSDFHFGGGVGSADADRRLSSAIMKIPIQLVCNEAGLDKVEADQIVEVASRTNYVLLNYSELFDNASNILKDVLDLENTIKNENMQIERSAISTPFAGEKTSNRRAYNWGAGEQRTEPENLEDRSLPRTSTSKHENRKKDRYLQEIYDAIYGKNEDYCFEEGTPEYYKAAEHYALTTLSTQANQHLERENHELAYNRSAQAQQEASSITHLGNGYGCPVSILPNVSNFNSYGNYSATSNYYNSLYCEMAPPPQPNADAVAMSYGMQAIPFNYTHPMPVSEFQPYYAPYTPSINWTINETFGNTYMEEYGGNGGSILYASRTYDNHTRSG